MRRTTEPRWFDEAAQARLIRWFGTRAQVIWFVAICGLYVGCLALLWFNPGHWHFLGLFGAAHRFLEAFAVFAAIVFAPMMTYMTIESELLNRLLIMKAERAEAQQAAQDRQMLRLLEGSAMRTEALQTILTSLVGLVEQQDARDAQMAELLKTMQAYDKLDAADLDVIRAFVESVGPEFADRFAAIESNHAALRPLLGRMARVLDHWEATHAAHQ